jgi:hypothetical protein
VAVTTVTTTCDPSGLLDPGTVLRRRLSATA